MRRTRTPVAQAPHGAMPPTTTSPGSAPRPSPIEIERSRNQQLSIQWNDENSIVRRPARLQFEVAECVETKTVTTTTTTKRSYPPLYVREPRSLQSLDSKEYPLASRPTPPELTRVTLDLGDFDAERWSFDEPSALQVCCLASSRHDPLSSHVPSLSCFILPDELSTLYRTSMTNRLLEDRQCFRHGPHPLPPQAGTGDRQSQ
jgi:hypothetical protein